MPDTLTPAERAAIAAFPENQVQRIDPGVLGGVYPNYVYLASGNRKPAAAWFARAVTVKPDEQDVILEIMRAFTDTQSVM